MNRRSATLPRKKRRLIRSVSASRSMNFAQLQLYAQAALPSELAEMEWGAKTWVVTDGRLTKTTGKRRGNISLVFHSPLRPDVQLPINWIVLIQALVVMRFATKQQAVTNQRQFIASAATVAVCVVEAGRELHKLNYGDLEKACYEISNHYTNLAAYSRHNSVEEFVRAGVEYGVFSEGLKDYRYSARRRPENQSGLGYSRLDDPAITYDETEKMVDPKTIAMIGELFRKVPSNHKYRFYILMLSFAAILGRRFSEIASLPAQRVRRRDSGRCSVYYFPGKQVRGRNTLFRKKIWLPSHTVDIVTSIMDEMLELTQEARARAKYMVKNRCADTRFLSELPTDMRIYAPALPALGLPEVWLDSNKWLAKNGFVYQDVNRSYGGPAKNYTYSSHLIARCNSDYRDFYSDVKFTDQHGSKYYIQDLMLVRSLGSSSGSYSPWVPTECTHAMFTTFLRYLPALSMEVLDASIEVDFTTHSFRHTLATLLDEGGLSDLVQAEFFARGLITENPTYQHQSAEQKALTLRKDLLSGKAKGYIAEIVMLEPVDKRESIIIAMTNGFHDVGIGCCTHPLIKEPCPNGLQCECNCQKLVYDPESSSQKDEFFRRLEALLINLKTVSRVLDSERPRASHAWVASHEKSFDYLRGRLLEAGVSAEDINFFKRKVLDEN